MADSAVPAPPADASLPPETGAPDKVAADKAAASARLKERRLQLFRILGVVLLVAALAYAIYWWIFGRNAVATDNAYVGADSAQVTPLVASAVTKVHVIETQGVRAGQVLVELDGADARIALQQASAQLATAQAHVSGYYANDRALAGQVASSAAGIAAADAKVASAAADLDRARIDLQRRQALVGSGAVSGDELTAAQNSNAAAVSALATARAGRIQAAAQVAAARGNREANGVLISGVSAAENPEVRAARAAVDKARLDLERTVIRAPIAGVVAKKSVQVGQRVALGAPMMSIVPVDTAFVDANFKESQLTRVRVGQPVTLHSDLYGGHVVYHGVVTGLSGGTGAAFALIPAQNASGNWIKVVQRLPVRITLRRDELLEHPLRIGLSMSAKIDVSNAR
jgi:membrane fusion protein (multidrug efflux system)